MKRVNAKSKNFRRGVLQLEINAITKSKKVIGGTVS